MVVYGRRGRVATQPGAGNSATLVNSATRASQERTMDICINIFQLSRIVAGRNYGLLVVDGEDVGKTGRGEGRGKKWDQLKIGEGYCGQMLQGS